VRARGRAFIMSTQLLHKEPEVSVEERMARLESDVAHIRSDVADIKTDLRKQSDRIDSLRGELHRLRDRLEDKIEALRVSVDDKIEALRLSVEGKIEALRLSVEGKIDALSQRLSRAMVWALLLYIALASALLGVLARGFGWL
jgi:chromosome segregation ATPase